MPDPLADALMLDNAVWAIRPEALLNLQRFYAAGAAQQAPIAASPRVPTIEGSIAVIPVTGLLSQRGGGFLDFLFGGTSTDAVGAAIDKLVADDSIGGIVLDVNSPGGQVYGLEALAAKIRAAREVKPVVGIANSEAASAAYYILSQTSPAIVAPGGMVGSIGTLVMHQDASGLEEQIGVKTEYIAAGKYKTELWENKLTDEARSALQGMVDQYYAQFVADVAKGRGVPKSTIEKSYGQGRMVTAQDALAAGMVDRIQPMDEMLRAMMPKSKRQPGMRASIERERLELMR